MTSSGLSKMQMSFVDNLAMMVSLDLASNLDIPLPNNLSSLPSLPGAFNATHSSYFGEPNLPTTMAFTDCYGRENQLGNCTGFLYEPYVPRWYCSNDTLAGVMCIG